MLPLLLLFVPVAGLCFQTSTHDDPIIVQRGSVLIDFGAHTRGITDETWAAPSGNRFLYYQHAHLEAVNKVDQTSSERIIQGFFRAKFHIFSSKAKLQYSRKLTLAEQRRLRIEIYLKGKSKTTGAFESLGTDPQLILSAVKKSTPCCMHHVVGEVTLRPAPPFICPPIAHSHSAKSDAYKWSWELSSDVRLEGGSDLIEEPIRGGPLVRLKYPEGNHTDLTIDSWEIYLVDSETQAKGKSVSSSYGRFFGHKYSKISASPLIEVCANENGFNGKSDRCLTKEFQCSPKKAKSK